MVATAGVGGGGGGMGMVEVPVVGAAGGGGGVGTWSVRGASEKYSASTAIRATIKMTTHCLGENIMTSLYAPSLAARALIHTR